MSSSNEDSDSENRINPGTNNTGPGQHSSVQPTTKASTNLLEYLKSHPRGKEILIEYQNNNNILLKTTRSKLVRLVIEREKNWRLKDVPAGEQLEKFQITKQRFMLLREEICGIFQNENVNTYYQPYTLENGIESKTDGKLWWHYCYEKTRLREIGLLKKKVRSEQLKVINDEENEMLNWLEANTDDWARVTLSWDKTFEARRNKLIVGRISTKEYIDLFPCLRIQKGVELIHQDFQKLYPHKAIVNENKWKIIKNCIKVKLLEVNRLNDEDKTLKATLCSNILTSDQEDFLILYFLPYIVASQRPKKRKVEDNEDEASQNSNENQENQRLSSKRPNKLSISERRERFILHIKTIVELETAVSNLKEKIKAENGSFQPLIIAVGKDVFNITEYMVVINDQFFKKYHPLDALELAIEVFFAFDCSYPENSYTLWLFVQKCLFDIKLINDPPCTTINILLGYISSELEKNKD